LPQLRKPQGSLILLEHRRGATWNVVLFGRLKSRQKAFHARSCNRARRGGAGLGYHSAGREVWHWPLSPKASRQWSKTAFWKGCAEFQGFPYSLAVSASERGPLTRAAKIGTVLRPSVANKEIFNYQLKDTQSSRGAFYQASLRLRMFLGRVGTQKLVLSTTDFFGNCLRLILSIRPSLCTFAGNLIPFSPKSSTMQQRQPFDSPA
jgi:hypothetical protein